MARLNDVEVEKCEDGRWWAWAPRGLRFDGAEHTVVEWTKRELIDRLKNEDLIPCRCEVCRHIGPPSLGARCTCCQHILDEPGR
jgi:hypothetical protein